MACNDTLFSAGSNVAKTAQTKTSTTSENERFDEILRRLRDCEGLVEQELEAYRSIDVGSSDDAHADVSALVSIVIPVYNEEATVARVVSRVAALPLDSELVIVDDCSTDGTRAILQRIADLPNVQVISKDKERRKRRRIADRFRARQRRLHHRARRRP